MSELSKIYSALMIGKANNEALATWVRNIDARDSVRGDQIALEAGIDAYRRLEAQLRDGRKHIDPPEDCKLTSCQCGSPNAAPPCGYCTSGIDEAEPNNG